MLLSTKTMPTDRRFTGEPPTWLALLLGIQLAAVGSGLGDVQKLFLLWTPFHFVCLAAAPWILRWYSDVRLAAIPLLAMLWPVGIVVADGVASAPWDSTAIDVVYSFGYILPALGLPWLVQGKVDRVVQVGVFALAAAAVFGLQYDLPLTDAKGVWKYALGGPVLLLVALKLGRPASVGLLHVPLVLGLLSLVSFSLGFRSNGAIAAVAAVVLLGLSVKRGTRPAVVVQVVLAVAAGVLAMGAYKVAASNGLLGESERIRYQLVRQEDKGLLESGRPMQVLSWMLIRQNPVFGLGSEPVLTPQQRSDAVATLIEHRLSVVGYVEREAFLSEFQAHSIMLAAWVRAGLLGALGALALPFTIVLMAAREYRRGMPEQFFPFLACALPVIAWDTYYSPLSTPYGVMVGVALAVVLASRGISGATTSADRTRRSGPSQARFP